MSDLGDRARSWWSRKRPASSPDSARPAKGPAPRKVTPESRRKAAEHTRRWSDKNPDKVREGQQRRNDRIRQAESHHTKADIEAQYARQGGKCEYCSEPVGSRFHVDHVVPISRGGSDGADNIAIACPPCNREKHNLTGDEYKARRASREGARERVSGSRLGGFLIRLRRP